MEAFNIVVFGSPSAKLQTALPDIKQSQFFPLPDLNDPNLIANENVQTVVQLNPEMVLVDIGDDYQHQNFIDQFQSLFTDNQPLMVGLLNGKAGHHETDILTKLKIDSYIFSDWSPEHIRTKLSKLNKLRIHYNELRTQIQMTSETAVTAMKAASEVGLLMQLVEWLQTANTLDDVANCLFKLCRCLDLNAIALIVDNNQREFFPQGMVHNSAVKLLSEAHQRDIRVLSRNRVQIFRLDYLVLMVTNAPWEDEETNGRHRDIVLQAAALAEAKARTITVNDLIISQHGKVEMIMDLIKNLSAETQNYAREIMLTLSEELATSAISLDLTDVQETRLLELSTKAQDSIEVLYQSSDALESHFHELISSITQVRELTESKRVESEEAETSSDEDDLILF